MAEIRIEKKRPNVWPWIVALVLVALLIWGIAAMASRRAPGNSKAAETSALRPGPAVATSPLHALVA